MTGKGALGAIYRCYERLETMNSLNSGPNSTAALRMRLKRWRAEDLQDRLLLRADPNYDYTDDERESALTAGERNR